MAELELYNATKSFGTVTVLKDVSLSFETGDIVGLFGRNGCGKSTLLKLLFGTLKADRLELKIDGVSVASEAIIPQKLIAYLPQESFIPKNEKVRDIIPMYYKSQEKQDTVFYNPGVAKIASKRVGDLSMGELRYFEVILIGNLPHPFLMLDEPFSMIEPLYKDAIKDFLRQLQSEKGLLITDHYFDDVLQMTTANFVISEGILTKINTKKELVKMKYLSRNHL